ncbi:hypothetical protein AMJ86_04455, partial [bacterium SM23_57]
ELVFPLDVPMVGIRMEVGSSDGISDGWFIGGGYWRNVCKPLHVMTDSDWFDAVHVSYTESDTELDMTKASVDAGFHVMGNDRVSLSLVGHYFYMTASQDVNGFNGWQRIGETSDFALISSTAHAIHYQVTYHSPQLGISSIFAMDDFTRFRLWLSGGMVFASDVDDHILRGKISEGDATGIGLYAKADLNIMPFGSFGRHVSLGVFGEFRYFQADGVQTQRWYRDGGNTPAGTEVSNIPHEFESYQYLIGLQVCFSFY